MKQIAKQLFAMALAMMMMTFAIGAPALTVNTTGGGYSLITASAATEATGTIEIATALEGATYAAYKIFDVKTAETSAGTKTTYSYTILQSSKWFGTVANYTVYKSANESATAATDAASYTGNGLTLTKTTQTDSDSAVWNVTVETAFSESDFATYLYKNVSQKTASKTASTKKDDNGNVTATLDGLTSGYYFVTTTAGTLCMLDTAIAGGEKVKINEKNALPTIGKTGDKDSAGVGESITYTITVKVSNTPEGNYVIHDVMSDGLTFEPSTDNITVYLREVTNAPSTYESESETETVPATKDNVANWSVAEKNGTCSNSDSAKVEGCDFEITIKQSYLKKRDNYDELIIVYTATVNENAASASDVTNKAYLEQKDSTSTNKETDNVKTENYDFDIVKYYEENSTKYFLDGATFSLYKTTSQTSGDTTTYTATGEPIEFVTEVETDSSNTVNTYYRPAKSDETGTTTIIATNGLAKIKGLESGHYALRETAAPDGYNPATSDTIVDLKADNVLTKSQTEVKTAEIESTATSTTELSACDTDTGVRVLNQSGAEIPSTGGIGTIIFYILGGILLVGAGTLLITRKRMSGQAR